MKKVPGDFDPGASGGFYLVGETAEIVLERLVFDEVPTKSVTTCTDVKID